VGGNGQFDSSNRSFWFVSVLLLGVASLYCFLHILMHIASFSASCLYFLRCLGVRRSFFITIVFMSHGIILFIRDKFVCLYFHTARFLSVSHLRSSVMCNSCLGTEFFYCSDHIFCVFFGSNIR